MKRLIALLLCLSMCLSLAPAGFAEEEVLSDIVFDDVLEAEDAPFEEDAAAEEEISLTISAEKTELTEGETLPLSALVTPEGAYSGVFLWASSDEAILTVDETGTVAAHTPGIATVTVTTEDDSIIPAEIALTVKAAEVMESIEEEEAVEDEETDEPEEPESKPIPVDGASGTCGDNLTWTLDNAGTLTISGTGAMTSYSGVSTFYTHRSSIKTVNIQSGVTSIGNYAFYWCSSLTSVTIPNSVTSIGYWAFSDCDSLTSVTIPDSVTSIGGYAFYDCDSLTSVTIPDSVTRIGNGAFRYCYSLTAINIAEKNKNYSSKDGVLFDKNKKVLIQYPGGKKGAYSIPNSVTSIGTDAFYDCSSLTSVTIPNSVTSIGSSAFGACIRLTSVTIGNSVTSIGDHAFYYCSSLTSVTIGNSVTSIGDHAFRACSSLTSVTIPNSVTSIGDYAFYDCSSLTSVTIPNSVTSIGDYAFYACGSLSDVYYGGTISDRERIKIKEGNSCLEKATWHYEEPPKSSVKIELFANYSDSYVCSDPISEFTSAMGSIGFAGCSEEKENAFYLKVTADIDRDGALIASKHVTVELPEGFSYEPYSLVTKKSCILTTDDTQEVFEVYPIYFEYTPSNVTFKVSGDLEGSKEIPVRHVENEGIIECRPTRGVNANPDAPIIYETDPQVFNDFLANTPNRYLQNVSELCCALSQAVYVEEYVENSYKNLGLSEVFYYSPLSYDVHHVGLIFGIKKVIVDNEVINLLVASIRGTIDKEWIGNFSISGSHAAEAHNDFYLCKERLLEFYNAYVTRIAKKGAPIRALFNAHSRAAAVVDLAVHELTPNDPNITAYTFAAPNSTSTPAVEDNIFNIIYSHDVVGYVPQGYGKYGTTIMIGPGPEAHGEWAPPVKVANLFEQYCGINYAVPLSPVLIGSIIICGTLLNPVVNTFACTIGDLMTISDSSPNIDFARAHGAENYLAWTVGNGIQTNNYPYEYMVESFRMTTDDRIGETIKEHPILSGLAAVTSVGVAAGAITNPVTRRALGVIAAGAAAWENGRKAYLNYIACPVDVCITDSSGNVLIQFIDHEITYYDSNSVYGAYSDGEGMFILTPDIPTELRITGAGIGTMDVTIAAMDFADDNDETAVMRNIPVAPGKEFSVSIPEDASVEDLVLTDDSGKEYHPVFEIDPVLALLDKGESRQLSVTKLGVTWSSSDSSIVSVFPDGVITALSYGSAEIFAEKDGETTSCKVYVTNSFKLLDQTYLLLSEGETAQLSLLDPAIGENAAWTVTDENDALFDANPVVSVSNGTITALRQGTAYINAALTLGEKKYTARCRVDVVEKPVKDEIELTGVELGTTAATVELYSTKYTALDVVLLLPQNLPASSALAQNGAAENNGVAVDSARFTDPATAEVFELVPLDDRRLAVVPREDAINNAKAVKGSYTSAVAVTVDDTEFATEAKVKLTVKKTLPKLKADAVSFNSFYPDVSCPVSITGATVTAIRPDESKKLAVPEWLRLEDGVLSLHNAPAKNCNGTVYLTVDTEEWAIPAAVSLSAKNNYKTPGLKLSAATATVCTDAASSRGVALKLLPKNNKETLAMLNVSGLSAPTGYSIESFDPAAGSFTLKPQAGFVPGKIALDVSFSDTASVVSLPLTVKTAAVALKAQKTSVTLNPYLRDSVQIPITATPADYILSDLNISITDTSGKIDKSAELYAAFANGLLTVAANENTVPGATYKLGVSAGDSKLVNITVKTQTEKNRVPALSGLKAAGSIDLSFPENTVTVTPTYKNSTGSGVTVSDWSVAESKGKTSFGEAKDQFTLAQTGIGFTLGLAEGAELTVGNTYTLTLCLSFPDGSAGEKTVKLPVKRTALNLKLSKTSLTLNKRVDDSTAITVSTTTKGYTLGEPIIELMDKTGKTPADGELTYSYSSGTLTVATNERTQYGATYKLLIKADEYSKPATLTVTIPAENKSAVTTTLKVSGSIDVIRDATSVTVTPTYKNCLAVDGVTKRIEVYSAADKYTAPQEGIFAVEESGNGFILRNIAADSTQKYKIKLISTFPNGESFESPQTAITVKMGSASLKAGTTAPLYLNDRYSRSEVRLTSTDLKLNDISRVEIKDAKYQDMFELYDYGGGDLAVGFKNNSVSYALKKQKSVSLALNVRIDGNVTDKPNATVTVKLPINQ